MHDFFFVGGTWGAPRICGGGGGGGARAPPPPPPPVATPLCTSINVIKHVKICFVQVGVCAA